MELDRAVGNFLPADILITIFSKLMHQDLARAAQTCKRFRALTTQDSLWIECINNTRYRQYKRQIQNAWAQQPGHLKEVCGDVISNRCHLCDVYIAKNRYFTEEGTVKVCVPCKETQTANWQSCNAAVNYQVCDELHVIGKPHEAGVSP